jgi:hypothetical protein
MKQLLITLLAGAMLNTSLMAADRTVKHIYSSEISAADNGFIEGIEKHLITWSTNPDPKTAGADDFASIWSATRALTEHKSIAGYMPNASAGLVISLIIADAVASMGNDDYENALQAALDAKFH